MFTVDISRSKTPIVCKGKCQSEQDHYLGSYQLTEKEPVMLAIQCKRCKKVTLTGAPITEPVEKKAA